MPKKRISHDKYARRRKTVWHRKGKPVASKVPLGAPLWVKKYMEMGVPEQDLFAELRTAQGVKRIRSLFIWQNEMREYLTQPYAKQDRFDELLKELKDSYRIGAFKPKLLRYILENPLKPYGADYGIRPVKISPKIKTKLSRSLARSGVLTRTRENGNVYKIEG